MKRGAAEFFLGALLVLPCLARGASDPAFPRHPLARTQNRMDLAEQGTLPLSLRAAADHWEKRLVADGWRLETRQAFPGKRETLHSTWRNLRSQKEASLMLVSSSPGQTLYLWHLSRDSKETRGR